jgi:hypothetical protein
MEYRKVPVVVRAVQLREDNDEEILEFMRVTECPFEMVGDHELVVHTLEGDMRASKNDWVIQGIKGEFYPCKPDIFEATYETAKEEMEELNSGQPAVMPTIMDRLTHDERLRLECLAQAMQTAAFTGNVSTILSQAKKYETYVTTGETE